MKLDISSNPNTMRFTKVLFVILMILTSPGAKSDSVPEGLKMNQFSGWDVTPCPACLASDAYGNVFVGVDLLGSLGKGPGAGRIVKLTDTNGDGKADKQTLFAEVDNPRGIIPIGDKLYVLHTEIPKDTKVLSGMHLSVFEDLDLDGVADGPPQYLVKNISVAESNRKRGADHTTNGIQLGIDGWIYVAVGDFGMVDAEGADGTKITMLGGGIVRVRPDGTEFEVYTHGLRNIYDVAIDPLMNIYTRGNTNDGGGWNIRFIHNIQSAEYGYPVLFKNFTEEILPALVDLGGGSGTGALFLQEPGWPEKYNNVPLMCDWGRSHLYIHRVEPDGASFTQTEERFIELSQITDATVDASGRLYLGAWDRAGFKGNPEKGYVVRVIPENWKYQPFPHLSAATNKELVDILKSESATARIYAQQEILIRKYGRATIVAQLKKLAESKDLRLESRVAAIFTLKQIQGDKANRYLGVLSKDEGVREFAIRAMTDRKSALDNISDMVLLRGLKDSNPRVQVASAIGIGRLGKSEYAKQLLRHAKIKGADPLDFKLKKDSAKPVYQSRQVKRDQQVKVKANIKGFKELFLGVGDSNDGSGNDHGAWFNPVLVREDGTKVPLTDLKWKSAKGGWGKTLVNKDCIGRTLKTAKGEDVEFGIGTHSPSVIAYDLPPGFVRFEASAGMSSSAGGGGTVVFSVGSEAPDLEGDREGPHAEPNPSIILPHVAVHSVVSLGAFEEALASVGTPRERAALWALKYMHKPEVVDGLIQKYQSATSSLSQKRILTTLIRLYHREQQYDGSWWWGTRPDTRGPYYRTETWGSSSKIAGFLENIWSGELSDDVSGVLKSQLLKHRVTIDGIDLETDRSSKAEVEAPDVDLASIASKQGEVGKMAIEDIIIAVDKLKGDNERGRQLFTQQGCVACHTLDKNEALKGPFMGHIGGIMKPEQIAEAIIKPNATISQGFATFLVSTKTGAAYAGFISAETADELEIRDITGQVRSVKTSDISERKELETSMMPPGLASALSLQDFASLVHFLANQKN